MLMHAGRQTRGLTEEPVMIMLEKWSSLSLFFFFLLQSFQPSRGCLSLWEDVCLPPVVRLLWALKLI